MGLEPRDPRATNPAINFVGSIGKKVSRYIHGHIKMSGSQVARLAKPTQMRNHSTSKVVPLLIKAFVLSCTTTFGYYWFIFKARKEAYRDYYANYDTDRVYEQMKRTGVFQSTGAIAEAAAEAAGGMMKNKPTIFQTLKAYKSRQISAIYERQQ